MSENFLLFVVALMGIVVCLGFFNEKVTGLTYEISLMLFSVVIGIAVFGVLFLTNRDTFRYLMNDLQILHLDSFLMEGVLCFMLFAGSCHIRLDDFRTNARAVGVLSVLGTFLGAVLFGLFFYLCVSLTGVRLPLPVCLLFGSIVSPTDPIAATSILNKFGLPEKTGFIIEGESLLNDGVGVALFVCFSNMVEAAGGGNFFSVMLRELFGAVAVGAVVTWLCFRIFLRTEDPVRQIFCSILAVSLSYVICEKLDFSGAIASVVCGVLFSSFITAEEERGRVWDLDLYEHFWTVTDTLLNSVLYVMLGLTFMHLFQMEQVIILSLAAIAGNLIGRAGSVGISSLLIDPIPDGFSRWEFTKLLTWGGLRGGLCIALAMSTATLLGDEVYHIVLGGAYAIVFFTTVVQGLTMKRFYEKMRPSSAEADA